MSFILKALQKLEEENAARPAEPAAIESAILAPSARTTAAPRRILTAVVLVFLAGGALTFLFMPKAPPPVAPRQSIVVAPSVPPPPVAPAMQATPDPPAAPSPATAAVPAVPADTSPTKPASAVEGNLPRAASRGRHPARRERVTGDEGEKAPTAVAIPAPPATAVDASAQLAVNGIAFQDDPGASAAVVNGVYVKRGMTVGGARVERIFQDKVRFSRNGTTFEVPLTK